MSVRMTSNFSRGYFYSFCLIFTKLGTHDVCANTQKAMEQIFKILIFKIFGKFKPSLWNSSSRAI